MKSVGLIVEYNPFHNGHKYHLNMAREITNCDITIGVMSGDYVQRGEPAGVNRWKRAEMALLSGVDIIVELPLFYSTQSAQIFAKGAIEILYHLGVEGIVFGSENGDVETLKKIASLDETPEFKKILQERLKEGLSYPKGYSLALEEMGIDTKINSNDILGLEYIKSGKKYSLEMIPIKRIGANYHQNEIVGGISSATGVRERIREINLEIKKGEIPFVRLEELKKLIPEESYNLIVENLKKEELNEIGINKLEDFYPFIRYQILNNFESLKEIQDIDEGLDFKFYESAKKNESFQEFFDEVKSKRYTIGRVQRALIHTLLGVTKELTQEIKERVPYIRVLGFNKKGQKYLKELKKKKESFDEEDPNEKIQIITSLSNIKRDLKERDRELLEFNERGSIIYRMVDNYSDRKVPIIIEGNDE